MTDQTVLRRVGLWVTLLMVANVVSTGIFIYASSHADETARKHNCAISEQGDIRLIDILAAQSSTDEDGPPDDLEARVAAVKELIRSNYDDCR